MLWRDVYKDSSSSSWRARKEMKSVPNCHHEVVQSFGYVFAHFHQSLRIKARMKLLSLTIVKAPRKDNDPIPLTFATDLSTFGFFQRQVSH